MGDTLKNLPLDYVSVSQINLYRSCPEKYNKKYITNELQSNYTNIFNLLLGSAFDYYISNRLQGDKEIIKNYSNNYFYWKLIDLIKDGKLESNEKKYDLFMQNWDRLNYGIEDLKIDEINELLNGFMTYEDYEKLITGYEEELKSGKVRRPSCFELYQNIINYYHENENAILNNLEIYGIQEKLEFTYKRYGKDINLLGYVDLRGYYINNDKIFIRDWKVSKKSKNIDNIQSDQDLIYSWLVWKIFGKIPIFEYYCFIISEKKGEVKNQIFYIKHTEESLNELESHIYNSINGINKKVFYKNESSWLCNFNYCEYFNECQKYKKNMEIMEV